MRDFNGENDATRYGRKGPNSAAALTKTLSALYKGEEEDFLRVDPKGGFSMHNPPSWVSGRILPIRCISSSLNIQSSDFNAGTTPGC